MKKSYKVFSVSIVILLIVCVVMSFTGCTFLNNVRDVDVVTDDTGRISDDNISDGSNDSNGSDTFISNGITGNTTDGNNTTNNGEESSSGTKELQDASGGDTTNPPSGINDETLEKITLTTVQSPLETLALTDVVAECVKSVVEINVTLSSGTSAGSGVMVYTATTEGYTYLMTCLHVVEGASSVKVKLNDGSEYNAQFVGGVPDNDIAVIRIPVTENITLAKIRDTSTCPIKLAEDAIAIGNPLGTLGGSVTKGIISATSREINIEGSMMNLLQTDAAINGGNSGGALFDRDGLLIGIVNAKYSASGVEGLGFAIPVEQALDISQKLLDTRGNKTYNGLGYIEGKIMLGVTTQSGKGIITSFIADNNYANVYASYVASIGTYGSAVSSSLLVNDFIIKVDGEDLSDERSLGAILKTKKIGDTMVLKVARPEIVKQSFFGTSYKLTEVEITITLQQYVYGYNYSK